MIINKEFESSCKADALSDSELAQVNGGQNPVIPVNVTVGPDGLVPGEIVSLDVLKEASSEAVYGSRANGVVDFDITDWNGYTS